LHIELKQKDSMVRNLIQENHAILQEAKQYRAEAEQLELEIIPELNAKNQNLENEMRLLKLELEETLDSESALRMVFLQEQKNRMKRRSQLDLN